MAASKAQIEELCPRLRVIQQQIGDLNSAFLDGKMQLPELRELKNPLVEKKVELEAKLASQEGTKAVRLEPLRNWINSANAFGNTVFREDWPEMRRVLEKTGSNPVLRAQTLTVSFLKPWGSLAQTVGAGFADNELAHASEKWWR